MYNPEVYTRTAAQQVKIGKDPIVIPSTNQNSGSDKAAKIIRDWQLIALMSILLLFFMITFGLQHYRAKKKLSAETKTHIESDEL